MKNIVNKICKHCNKSFEIDQRFITYCDKINENRGIFCSNSCSAKYRTITRNINVVCETCNITFKKLLCQIKITKHNFCCRSCAATYNNSHKKTGTRRSKLELFLENKIKKYYPKLKILFNDRTKINMELDFYLPQQKVAIEVNGIYHYKPIYGDEKFKGIKINDKKRRKLCKDNNIKLHIIKNKIKHFTNKEGEKYWKKFNKLLSLYI